MKILSLQSLLPSSSLEWSLSRCSTWPQEESVELPRISFLSLMRGCQEWPVCDGFHGGGCHCGGGGCHGGGGGFESLSLFEARANRSYPQTPITFIKCILQSKIDKLTFTPITFTFIMDLPTSQNMNMALTLKNMTTLWVLIYSCMYVMISFWHLGHHWNTWEEETDAQRMEDGRKLLFSILVNLSMILTTCYTI